MVNKLKLNKSNKLAIQPIALGIANPKLPFRTTNMLEISRPIIVMTQNGIIQNPNSPQEQELVD